MAKADLMEPPARLPVPWPKELHQAAVAITALSPRNIDRIADVHGDLAMRHALLTDRDIEHMSWLTGGSPEAVSAAYEALDFFADTHRIGVHAGTVTVLRQITGDPALFALYAAVRPSEVEAIRWRDSGVPPVDRLLLLVALAHG